MYFIILDSEAQFIIKEIRASVRHRFWPKNDMVCGSSNLHQKVVPKYALHHMFGYYITDKW